MTLLLSRSVLRSMYSVVLMILSTPLLFAQNHVTFYNSEEVWRRLQPFTFQSPLPDHSIILVSNRKNIDTGLRFMDMAVNENEQLSYFVIAEQEGKWLYQRMNSLSAALQLFNLKQHWVIYNEGMGKVFTANVFRGLTLSRQYKCSVIMLDYPSISSSSRPIKSYRFAVKHARSMYNEFLPALDSIRMLLTGHTQSINLFMHSMGNYLMRKMAMKQPDNAVLRSQWLNNVIFNAACVPARFHRRWMKRVDNAQQLWVHYNPSDRTLYYAELAMLQPQLGRKPGKRLSADVEYVNFQPIVGNGHSNFFSWRADEKISDVVHQHYYQLFHGENPLRKMSETYRLSSFKSIGVEFKEDPAIGSK